MTEITYHAIEADFRNEYGQKVIVITCPFLKTTIAQVDRETCACGIQI